MIKFNFSPVRADNKTAIRVSGSTVIVNGTDFDLSQIPDGATVDHPVIQNCTRTGDDYELTLQITHGPNAPYETRFPEPVEVTDAEWEYDYIYEPEPEPEPEPEAAADELAK